MNRAFLLILLLLTMARSWTASAEDNPLLGTWKLKSFVREVAGTGERYDRMGDQLVEIGLKARK
jgi:hypothetical protein